MINVHYSQADQYLARGWVMVGQQRLLLEDDTVRIDLCDPATTCLKPMRGYRWTSATGRDEIRQGLCRMDKGHRGRCSTATFVCDVCNKTRRSRPAHSGEIVACWLCFGPARLSG